MKHDTVFAIFIAQRVGGLIFTRRRTPFAARTNYVPTRNHPAADPNVPGSQLQTVILA